METKLSKHQQRLFDKVQSRLLNCLDYYEKDKTEGYKNILRLIFAEKIRFSKYIRPVLPTLAKNDDPRAQMVEKVTKLQMDRFIKNVKQQQAFLEGILLHLGGIHRSDDKLKFTNWKIKKKYYEDGKTNS